MAKGRGPRNLSPSTGASNTAACSRDGARGPARPTENGRAGPLALVSGCPEVLRTDVGNQHVFPAKLPKQEPPFAIPPPRNWHHPHRMSSRRPKSTSPSFGTTRMLRDELNYLPDRGEPVRISGVLLHIIQNLSGPGRENYVHRRPSLWSVRPPVFSYACGGDEPPRGRREPVGLTRRTPVSGWSRKLSIYLDVSSAARSLASATVITTAGVSTMTPSSCTSAM